MYIFIFTQSIFYCLHMFIWHTCHLDKKVWILSQLFCSHHAPRYHYFCASGLVPSIDSDISPPHLLDSFPLTYQHLTESSFFSWRLSFLLTFKLFIQYILSIFFFLVFFIIKIFFTLPRLLPISCSFFLKDKTGSTCSCLVWGFCMTPNSWGAGCLWLLFLLLGHFSTY